MQLSSCPVGEIVGHAESTHEHAEIEHALLKTHMKFNLVVLYQSSAEGRNPARYRYTV